MIVNIGMKRLHSPQEQPMTLNINLTPQLEEMVRRKVADGRYNSASEVVREALRLMEERDRLLEIQHEELRREVRKGIDSGAATPLDIEDIKARGRRRLAAQKREA
jgi:antitoxin ParD1/3/4